MKQNETMCFEVKTLINDKEIVENIERNCKTAQAKLDAQIIKDSNYYCPLKTGALQKSAVIHTVIGSGLIVWRAPYARKQYYGVNFDRSKDPNPNACAKWFEAAKARHLEQWLALFRRSLSD